MPIPRLPRESSLPRPIHPRYISGAQTTAAQVSRKFSISNFDLNEDSAHTGSSTVNLTQHEISNSEAQAFLGWEWEKSSTVWLDDGVASEICHFSRPIKVASGRTRVSHVERVTGLPSQFPIPSEATAFLIDVTHIPDLDPGTTVDALLKDQVYS